jgi:hypothetical protein
MTFSVREDLQEISYQRFRQINKRDTSAVLEHDGGFVSRVFQSYTYPTSPPYWHLMSLWFIENCTSTLRYSLDLTPDRPWVDQEPVKLLVA